MNNLQHNFQTHRTAWRKALAKMISESYSSGDRGYWQHELNAFDEAYAAHDEVLKALHPMTKTPWTKEHSIAYPSRAANIINAALGFPMPSSPKASEKPSDDPCPQCLPGTICKTPFCGRLGRNLPPTYAKPPPPPGPPPIASHQADKVIDMILHCPACGLQHIDAPDAPDFEAMPEPPSSETPPDEVAGRIAALQEWQAAAWDNRPHRSHLCQNPTCKHVWRPADVPTNGVDAIKTKGKDDSVVVHPVRKYK